MRKSEEKTKYNIRERLDELPYYVRNKAFTELVSACGRSRQQFYRWMSLKISSKSEIPGYALIILADYFDCHPRDLFNSLPENSFEHRSF